MTRKTTSRLDLEDAGQRDLAGSDPELDRLRGDAEASSEFGLRTAGADDQVDRIDCAHVGRDPTSTTLQNQAAGDGSGAAPADTIVSVGGKRKKPTAEDIARGRRIARAIRRKDLNQRQVAAVIGVTAQSVNQWTRGLTRPEGDNATSLVALLMPELRAEDLLGGTRPPSGDDVSFSLTSDVLQIKRIPRISYELAGRLRHGEGFSAMFEAVTADTKVFDQNQQELGPFAFTVSVIGDAMSPRVEPGDLAHVDPDIEPEHKQYVLARMGDGHVVLRQLVLDGTRRQLRSFSADHPPVELTDRDEIIGVVTKIERQTI